MKGSLFAWMWIFSLCIFAQNNSVRGTITDSRGESLIGVTVQVQGTTNGTITDVKGNYLLNNVPANATLEISYVGMKPQIIKVNNRTTINVTMSEDTELLDEVVVVGYGTMRKSDVTGSIAVTKGDDMIKKPIIQCS